MEDIEWELRRRIVERAADDEPRLAYAAWCDSVGEKSRGEYIRLQVARGKVAAGSAEAERFFAEEMKVIRGRKAAWVHAGEVAEEAYKKRIGTPYPVFGISVERGFVRAVSGGISDFLAIGEEICAVEPVEHVGLFWDDRPQSREKAGDIERVAQMKVLGRMKGISLSAEAGMIRGLSKSRHVGRVESLSIVTPGRAAAGNAALVEAIAEALGGAFRGVRRLDVIRVEMGVEGVRQLCACTSVGRLERLNLPEGKLGDAGAKVLAECARLGDVKELLLPGNGITNEGVKALAASGALLAVRDLNVGKNRFDAEGMRALVEHAGLPKLERVGIKESVHEEVDVEWTDWEGSNIGGGKEMRPMKFDAVMKRFPTALEFYE